MSALFTVVVALAMFAIFTSAVGNLAIQRIRGSSRAILQQRAAYACQAGFALATEWLEQRIVYNDAANTLTFSPILTNNFNTNHTNLPLVYDPDTRVTVRITSNLLGANNITGPDGVNIEPGQVYIMTLGVVGSNLAPANSRHLGGMACLGTQNYPYAIQAEGPVNLTNVKVSTFTSFDVTQPTRPLPMFWQYHRMRISWKWGIPRLRLTTYANALAGGGAGQGSGPLFPSNFPEQARISSNARVNAIRLDNSMVDGRLYYGPGGSPSAVFVNVPQTWVSQPPSPSVAPLYITKYKPPVDPATVTTDHSGGSLTLNPGQARRNVRMSGGTLTLNCNSGSNEFYLSGDVNLNNVNVVVRNASINTRAKLYLGRSFVANNCRINRECGSWRPLISDCASWSFNLSLLACGSGGVAGSAGGDTLVNITNSDTWALLGGNAMKLNVTGGQIGGAIKAGSVNMTNTNMWYDVGVNANIAGHDIGSTLWGRVSWTLSGVTDYGESLYLQAQSGPGFGGAAGALAPQGPGAAAVGLGGAAATGSANLGANAGPAIAGPNTASVGTGATATAAAFATSGSGPSFWATLLLGQ